MKLQSNATNRTESEPNDPNGTKAVHYSEFAKQQLEQGKQLNWTSAGRRACDCCAQQLDRCETARNDPEERGANGAQHRAGPVGRCDDNHEVMEVMEVME